MDIYPIGVVIESRLDGSIIYSSHKGILNLDNTKELREAQREDEEFLKGNQE
jgi:hypothetical protein